MQESFNFDIPILLIIFNRPENTKEVFEVIKKIQPKQLFVAADGPRYGVEDEEQLCARTRKVATDINWDCSVKTLFRKENLGCEKAVSEGITWFFENVEQGIILEDDCVPNTTFFYFCEKLLSYYWADTRIMMIAGTNYLSEGVMANTVDSYFLSNYYPIWGWATWRRAWKLYDSEMKFWEHFQETRQLDYIFSHRAIGKYYQFMFNLIRQGFNTWDIQWWYTCIFNHGLSIIPKFNLISNNGLTGTHMNTQGNFYINMPTRAIDYENLKHPAYIFPDRYLNELTFINSHAQIVLHQTIIQRINSKMKSLLKNLINKIN